MVLAIFKKFNARYLSKFSIAGIEKLAMNEWAEVLAGVTDEQIRHGMGRLPEEWPPTAMEFKKLCRQVKGNPSFKDFPKIEVKPSTPEEAGNQIAKLKDLLK